MGKQKSSRLKTAALVLLCAAILACAVFLPVSLASAGDKALTGEVYLIPAEDALVVPQGKLSVVEKLSLLESATEADFYPVSAGSSLDEESFSAAAAEGLQQLMALGILPEGGSDWIDQFDDTQINFVMKADTPGRNMILWLCYFTVGDVAGSIFIDDETGLILQCSAVSRGDGPVTALSAGDWMKAWGAYLGITYLEDALEEGQQYSSVFEQNGVRVDIAQLYGQSHFMFASSPHMSLFSKKVTISTQP